MTWIQLIELPWWTDADQADLAAKTNDLVESLWEHKESGCPRCAEIPITGGSCPFWTEQIQPVVDWRESRERRNRLRWVRLALSVKSRKDRAHPLMDDDRFRELLRSP